MQRSYHLVGWTYALACAWLGLLAMRDRETRAAAATALAVQNTTAAPPQRASTPSANVDAAEWFRRVKPYCNTVEVQTLQSQSPAPATTEGAGYHAACFALAGRIDDARRIIDALPDRERYKAVGIVFDIGHPVADAGDDRSAGPIMEMVVDYWPNHYMALYHAGMAEYMLGQRDLARHNLEEFQKYYHEHDGWTQNAVDVLKRLNDPNAVAARRPAEPQ